MLSDDPGSVKPGGTGGSSPGGGGVGTAGKGLIPKCTGACPTVSRSKLEMMRTRMVFGTIVYLSFVHVDSTPKWYEPSYGLTFKNVILPLIFKLR